MKGIHFYVTERHEKLITEWAQRERITKSELVRHILDEWFTDSILEQFEADNDNV